MRASGATRKEWTNCGRLARQVRAGFIQLRWPEFRMPDFDLIAQTLFKPVIFDGRNLYDPR